MLVAELGQSVVGEQSVGVNDRPRGRRRLRERLQRSRLRVGQHLQAQPPRSMPANLDHSTDERLLAVLAAAFETFLVAAEPELVDLDLALQELALGSDHRPAQLLQDQPRRLVAREPELALELLGGDPRVMGGDQISRPKPGAQRRARSMHHRPGRHRGLQGAGRALPQVPPLEHPGAAPAAARAAEPHWPAGGRKVGEARGVSREAVLELQNRAREVWTSHRCTVGRTPDGTGYASAGYSHSIVPGGFEVMSSVTRFTCWISLIMREATRSSRS